MSARLAPPALCALLLVLVGCSGSDGGPHCDPHYAFDPGEWRGGEGSAPGGLGADDHAWGDDDDAAWGDDDDAADDDDATWGDDDDAADDDDVADDDDALDDDDTADDDDALDDDDTADDDDSAEDASADTGSEGRDDEERDDDGIDPMCLAAPATRTTQFLSADDSNSQADPIQHREMIEHHGRVPTRAKAWEYLNYFDFDYPAADPGTVRIVPEIHERDGAPGRYDLVVAAVAPDLAPADRRPFNLVFSVDVSGSMGGPGLEHAQHVMRAIAGSLRSGDFVSVVIWSEGDSVVLQHHRVDGPDDPTLLDVVNRLVAGGSTNLDSGLAAAYDLALAEPINGTTNRVLLISDGGANVGQTSARRIAEHAQDGESAGVFLAAVGVPPASSFDDALMDQVTDLGRGAYLYVDSECEARRQFTPDGLNRIFGVAAMDVRLELELPPGLVVERFTGEQISYQPSEVVPQHLSFNDQMLYDLDLLDCARDAALLSETITFGLAWTDPTTGEAWREVLHTSLGELLSAPRERQRKAEAIVAYAETFAAVARQDNAYRQIEYLDAMIEYLAQVQRELRGDPDLAHLEGLLRTWRGMY